MPGSSPRFTSWTAGADIIRITASRAPNLSTSPSFSTSSLSTPAMIAIMERNAAMLAAEHLGGGQATVGFEVCVKHVAPAIEGAECTVHARLREVDGRKLRFDVEVVEGERTIGVGTHERRVVAR